MEGFGSAGSWDATATKIQGGKTTGFLVARGDTTIKVGMVVSDRGSKGGDAGIKGD